MVAEPTASICGRREAPVCVNPCLLVFKAYRSRCLLFAWERAHSMSRGRCLLSILDLCRSNQEKRQRQTKPSPCRPSPEQSSPGHFQSFALRLRVCRTSVPTCSRCRPDSAWCSRRAGGEVRAVSLWRASRLLQGRHGGGLEGDRGDQNRSHTRPARSGTVSELSMRRSAAARARDLFRTKRRQGEAAYLEWEAQVGC